MSVTSAIHEKSGLELLELLKKKRQQLIAEKKILDKKDTNAYPIKNVPFEIPSNWTWCYLSDVSIIQEGPGIRKHQYFDSGIQFLTVTNILEGDVDLEKSKKYISHEQYKNYTHFTVKKGDIVTACSGGSWGKSAIYDLDEQIILNTSTLRLRFFNDLGNNRYLYYLTKTSYFKESLSIHTTGQQPNYGYFHYSKILIPLPPLSEQKRIVEILDEAFAAIDKAKANVEKNLQNAKELFESYLQNAFIDTADSWESDTLGNVCTLFQGLAINAKTKHALVEKSDLPLLRIKDLKNNTEEQYIDPNNYPKNALVTEDDIIYTRTGSLGLVFRGRKGVLHNNSFKVVPNARINKDFLFIWLQNPTFKTKILSLALRAAQPDITHAIFKEQEIIIPPLEEQRKIVRKLNALENKIKILQNIYEQKLTCLVELKKSILQKAFSGEHTAKTLSIVDED